MRILAFTIQNFKSFGKHSGKQDQVPGLSNINMIYGYNNSGKSNILKFLNLVFKSKTKTQKVTVEIDDTFKEMPQTNPSLFYDGAVSDCAFIYHKNDKSKPVEFEFTFELTEGELKSLGEEHKTLKKDYSINHATFPLTFKGTIKSIDGFDTGLIKLDSASIYKKSILSKSADGANEYFAMSKDLKGNETFFESIMSLLSEKIHFLDNGRYLKSEAESESKILTPENFKNWLYKLYINPETYSKFEDLIAFIKENKIILKTDDQESFKHAEALSPLSKFNPEFAKGKDGRYEIMLKAGGKRFPLSSFGTGIHQILFILTSIFESKPRIILIEEMEMNLSPKYQKELLAVFLQLISKKVIDQVFFTTHSKYFIYRNDFSLYEVNMLDEVSLVTKVKAKTTWKKFFTLE